MKVVSLSVTAAFVVILSCSQVHPAPQDSMEEKLTRLEVKFQQKHDSMFTFYQELLKKVEQLEKKVTTLESENKILQIDVQRLREKSGATGGGTPKEGEPSGDLAEVSMKIDVALAKLRSSNHGEEAIKEAAKELVPLSRYSTTKMAEALRQISNPAYTAALEQVLAKCPVEDLKGPLGTAAKDRLRRSSVARVVGAARNLDLSKILEPHIGDADPIVQVELGDALLACKNRMGVPPLLKALRASESEFRFRALMSLKHVNNRETYGFDVNKGSEENSAALKAWDDWWQKEGQKLFQ
jgi:hypothetical protein